MNWIDVEESRPGNYQKVLVAYNQGSVDVTFFCENASVFDHKKSALSRKMHGKWSKHFEVAHEKNCKITHWMPLPEAPKTN